MAKEEKVAENGMHLLLRQIDAPQPKLRGSNQGGLFIRINGRTIYIEGFYSKPSVPTICTKFKGEFVPCDLPPPPNFLGSVIDDDGDTGLVFGNDNSDIRTVVYPAFFEAKGGPLIKSRWECSLLPLLVDGPFA